jgi:hypothetical protein
MQEYDLKRILHQAMSQHIFTEPRKGYVAHTAISKKIAEDPLVRDWIAFLCVDLWKAAPRVIDAVAKWPGSEEIDHTASALANDAPQSLITEIGKYPERLARLPGAMQVVGSQPRINPSPFVDSVDWTDVHTLVDVGGGSGWVCF